MNALKTIAWIFVTSGLYAQPAQFEAASMKILPAGEPGRAKSVEGSQLHYPSVSLLMLVREAYRLNTALQVEGPGWMRTQQYDIEAKLPANGSKDRIPEMLQSLLTERLKLAVHHETRPLAANVLLIGKKPPKMHLAAEGDENLELKLEVPIAHLSGRGSMQQLIDQLNHGLGGRDPWLDMTGLKGFFEIKLDFLLGGNYSTASADNSPLPSLSEALEQQLGLRVDTRKAPADVVVVDRVDRTPVEN